MKHLTLKVLIFFLCILSISCSEKEDNKLLGQIIGSVAGAYLGSIVPVLFYDKFFKKKIGS